jgi:hypothetical protein
VTHPAPNRYVQPRLDNYQAWQQSLEIGIYPELMRVLVVVPFTADTEAWASVRECRLTLNLVASQSGP